MSAVRYSADVTQAPPAARWTQRVEVAEVATERKTNRAPVELPEIVSERRTDIPSARPTSVPDFDFAALATGSFARAPQKLPLDLAIPVRTSATSTQGLDLRSAFVLLHVDGISTVTQIAETAQLPVEDTVTRFAELSALGLVTLSSLATGDAPPISGVHPRSANEAK